MTIPKPRGQFREVMLEKGISIAYVAGKPVRNYSPAITILASVQPIPGEELTKLFPGGEVTEAVRIYTDVPLSPGQEGQVPEDRIAYNGKQYYVIEVQAWDMGQLDHFRALAIRRRA
jgi:hypothetical protein